MHLLVVAIAHGKLLEFPSLRGVKSLIPFERVIAVRESSLFRLGLFETMPSVALQHCLGLLVLGGSASPAQQLAERDKRAGRSTRLLFEYRLQESLREGHLRCSGLVLGISTRLCKAVHAIVFLHLIYSDL